MALKHIMFSAGTREETLRLKGLCWIEGAASFLLCRKQESEADAIGMQLAAKACFSPGAAALVFQKLGAAEQQQGVQIPTMLRTHPLSKVCFQFAYAHMYLYCRAGIDRSLS